MRQRAVTTLANGAEVTLHLHDLQTCWIRRERPGCVVTGVRREGAGGRGQGGGRSGKGYRRVARHVTNKRARRLDHLAPRRNETASLAHY